MILLDTHIFLWAILDSARLTPKAKALIESGHASRELALAAISLWECAMLAAKRRIELDCSIELWLPKALQRSGVAIIPLSPAIAALSTVLPGEFHGDPADRMIAATVLHEQATLITADEKLRAYLGDRAQG